MIRHGGKHWRCLVSAVALWCAGGGLASATTEVTAVSTENAPDGATAASSNSNHTLTVGGSWTLADNYRIGAKILGQMAPTGDMNYTTVVSQDSVFNFDDWDLALTGAATGGSMMMNGVSVTGADVNGRSLKIYGAIPYESLIGGTPSTSAVAISTNSVKISGASMNIKDTCQIYGETGVVGVDNGSVTISDTQLSVANDVARISGARCDQGSIINSKVEISDSTLTPQYYVYLYGAELSGGAAPENTLLKGNVVKLSGATLSPTLPSAPDSSILYIHGADFRASTNASAIVAGTEASGNSVTIKGDNHLDYNYMDLFGAYGYGVSAMTGNSVNISGGVFGYEDSAEHVSTRIYGAIAISDSAMSGNSVSISGGDFQGRSADVYASGGGTASSLNPNAVYLSGSPGGVEAMNLFGGDGTQSGSLYVGALRGDSGAELAAPLAATDKNGHLTNKFSSLNHFNNVYIYGLDPSAKAPVLSAGSFTAGNNAILHLEHMNLETLPADPVTLLQIDKPFIGTADGVVKVYNAADDEVKVHTLASDQTTQWVYDAPDKTTLTDVVLEATGKAMIVADPEKNTIILKRYGTGEVLNTVRVLGATGAGDTVPKDWTAPTGGPVIDAGTMTLPTDMQPGETRDILRASDNFFQTYRMKAGNTYTEESGRETDFTDGVQYASWVEKKGVRVTDKYGDKDNVIEYMAPIRTVTNISIGDVQWGKPRMATPEYEFSGVSMSSSGLTINASNLNLTVGNDYAAKLLTEIFSASLLIGATDLKPDLSVVGAEHSQNVGWTAGNGATLTAAMKGTVQTENGTIRYAIDDLTPTLVDLSGWDAGKAEDVVPRGWQKTTGIPVNAESIGTAPGSLLGDTTILTAKAGFFDDDKITGSYKYADRVSFNHEQDGVTLTGKWSRGVQTADGGARLVFVNGDLESSHVALGQMEWGKSRDLRGNCDFTGATVDTSALSFTGIEKIAAGDSSHLLTGATNLPGTTISHTQSFDSSTDNDVKLSATMTGEVVAASTGIDYNVKTVALNNVDISPWDSTQEAARLPDSWTTAAVTVTAGEMDAAPEELLGETKILIANSAGVFDDANISGVNKFAERKDFSHEKEGVTLSGTWSRGVKASEDKQSLLFVNGDLIADDVSLGSMKLGTSRDLTGKYDCDFTGASVSATGLAFGNLDAKTAVGGKFDLLTGAIGLAAGTEVTGANHTQNFDAPAINDNAETNGVKLSATLEGLVSVEEEIEEKQADQPVLMAVNATDAADGEKKTGKIVYTPTSITLNSVDLSGWNSAAGEARVEKTWTPSAAGVSVIAEAMDAAPESALGETTILTSDEACFIDDNISGADKYADRKEFAHEKDGVTISGLWSRGVKAAEDKKSLVFVNGDLKANAVTFGKMAWGTPRDLTGALNCDFIDAAADASGLVFTNLTAATAAGDTTKLLTGAKNLFADVEITGADHRQDFDVQAANGVGLSATLEGAVTASVDENQKGNIGYTAKRITLNHVDLSTWDSAKGEAVIGKSWTPNAAGVTVTADGMDAAPEKLLGETTILIADEGIFDDDRISGANKYGAQEKLDDEQNGVAISGTWSRGVNASADKQSLLFVNGDLKADDISFGTMDWGVSRDLTGKYNCDFSNAKVSAADLLFTVQNDDAANLAAGDSKLLLTGANGLAAGLPVDGADRSQTVDWTAGNKTTLTATMTGKVSTEADIVKYTVGGVTLDSVNLKNWDGTASTAPTTWKANAAGVDVIADGMNAAPEKLLGETTILSSAEACFTDDNISGVNKYGERKEFSHEKNGVTISGTWSRGVRAAEDHKSLVFVNGDLKADDISLGTMDWGVSRDLTGKYNCDFSNAKVSAADLTFTVQNDDAAKLAAGGSKLLLTGANGLAAGIPVDGADRSQTVGWTAGNQTTLTATMTGRVSTEAGIVKYTVGGVTLDSVNLKDWNGAVSDVPTGWTANAAGVAVTAEGFTVHPEDMTSHIVPILNASANTFSDAYITGDQAFHEDKPFRSEKDGVTLSGIWSHGVKASEDGAALLFEGGDVAVKGVDLGEIQWKAGAVIRTAAAKALNYKDAVVDTSSFSVANPTEAMGGQSVTLLAANDTLKDYSEQTKATYSYSPVEGVRLDGHLSGTISASNGVLAYNADANSATNLAFGTVEWKETGALMKRPGNISFDGAAVDTSAIAFTGVDMLHANDFTTLVTDFDGEPSQYIGDSYRLGTAIGGAGHASLSEGDLRYTIDTVGAAPETHTLLMGMGAGLAVLSTGNSFIDAAAEGLALPSNAGADGVSIFAKTGGSSLRQETGSHVDVHTWNAILALGHKNEKPKGTTEYGAFFEYGSGNYTTMDCNRGDGNATYTGGGLLAKWTAAHGFYVEGSLRGGSLKDDARSVMRDAAGTPYSYNADAGYFGVQLGIGRKIDLANGNVLDVYGKYFFNRRNGVSFDAGDHFDLDAATSQVLRAGARYTANREQWSFYGGLACEYELDGVASGRAEGFNIRSADLGGASVMAELGATIHPDRNSPWSLDLNVTGFAGKKQGVTGGVSVAFSF